jgi:serine/threonine protein kinase/tetratricopeptide (TPR) repeat protein
MDGTLANGELGSIQISRFTIVERLGSGAMGVVYRARDTLLKRDVALKLIRPDQSDDSRSRSRFIRECQAAAAINHPGIATIYEAGETDQGWLYLASELIDGETLKDRIGRGPVAADEVLDLGIQLSDALASAHEAGAIHRDIKPGNIMVTPAGRLKVLDFGLARLSVVSTSGEDDEETMTRTQAGLVMGTPAYMSPEQASGMDVDARTDIFAVGCVIYEMLAGASPFKSSSVPATLKRVLVEDPAPLESSVDGLPPGLDTILRKALAKERDDRYSTAREMTDDLKALQTSQFVPVSLVTKTRRRRILGLAVAAVAIIVAALIGISSWNRPSLAFENRDHLLIADVDNQTGDEAFDLALRTAVEADLRQSQYAKVVQRTQVRDTLRMMRRDPMTPVDEELGRDICRYAGIRALLLPRILSVGEAYELQAVLVDPITGHHVDVIRVTARGREEVLLEAIDEVTRTLRRRLGESMASIKKTDLPVARSTTDSWEALRYLSLANKKWGEAKPSEAVPLLEMAIEEDPDFAGAKGTLGLLLIQFMNEKERGQQYLREALLDGETLPQQEYLMLRAVNRQFVDEDLEAALVEYELICELYPENMAAFNNRGRILMHLKRYDESIAMFERATELDPQSTFPYFNRWVIHQQRQRRPRASEAVMREALARWPENAGFRSMLGWSLLSQGRFTESVPEYRAALEVDPDNIYSLPNLAYTLQAMGEHDEAAVLFRRVFELIESGAFAGSRWSAARDLAMALVASGRPREADVIVLEESKRMRSGSRGASLDAGDMLALAQLAAAVGRDDEARRWLRRAETSGPDDDDAIAYAEALALLGEHDAAVDALTAAVEKGLGDPFMPLALPPFNPLLGEPEFLALFGVDAIT